MLMETTSDMVKVRLRDGKEAWVDSGDVNEEKAGESGKKCWCDGGGSIAEAFIFEPPLPFQCGASLNPRP